jgi:cellulose synthase operon protein YhjQ
MKTIAIVAPVGGAGRSTTTAALASLLAGRGHAVLALECDPRNLLGLHFGLREPVARGLIDAALRPSASDWAAAGLRSDDDVLLVPWGQADGLPAGNNNDGGVDDDAEAVATRCLLEQPHWLRALLAQIDLPADGIVLIDSPAWPAPHAAQALAAADLALVLAPPEPEVCATLPRMQYAMERAALPYRVVATRVQPARQLHGDVLALLRTRLRERLLPYQVHLDHGLPEALARGENFCRAMPHSQAAHDLQGIAAWLSQWVAAAADAAEDAGARR